MLRTGCRESALGILRYDHTESVSVLGTYIYTTLVQPAISLSEPNIMVEWVEVHTVEDDV